MGKGIYLGFMFGAFFVCMVWEARLNLYLLDSSLPIHIDFFSRSLPISIHSIFNVFLLGVLVWIFFKSLSNYLTVVNTRHTTTLEKR